MKKKSSKTEYELIEEINEIENRVKKLEHILNEIDATLGSYVTEVGLFIVEVVGPANSFKKIGIHSKL